MDRAASRRFTRPTRRVFKWNRPMTPRNYAVESRIEQEILDRRHFGNDHSDLLSIFLDIPEYLPRCHYEWAAFKRIFNESIFQRTRDKIFDRADQLVAWVHDSSSASEPRAYNGSVTFNQLHRILNLKRTNQEGVVDADIRKIFMANPEPQALCILALVASEHDTPVVRRLLQKYVTMDTSIGLESTQTIGGEYILEFHMRSYVWRTDTDQRKDSRRLTDNTPMRRSIDVSFLTTSSPSEDVDFIHECQTSISVSGWNIAQGWTAHCFKDSFFDDETDPNNEAALLFYRNDGEQGQNEDESPEQTNCDTDALSLGKLTADHISLKDPREYFLKIVLCHVKRISREWGNTGYYMRQRIHEFLHDGQILPLNRAQSSLATAEGESTKVEKSEAWVRQTTDLLTSMIIWLDEAIIRWHKFIDSDMDRINGDTNEVTSGHLEDTLCEITDQFDEMEKVLEHLKYLQMEIENFKRQLSLRVAVDGSRAIVLQHWNVTILQFFSPMALAGSIMQAGLVFGNATLCFTVLTGILTIITYNMEYAVEWFDRVFRSTRRLGTATNKDVTILNLTKNCAQADVAERPLVSVEPILPPPRAWIRKNTWRPEPTPLQDLERSL